MSFDDFPEPLSFNGDEDDREIGFYSEHSGTRQQPGSAQRRTHLFCHECGQDVFTPISVSWLGIFCSPACATKASEKQATAMDQIRR